MADFGLEGEFAPDSDLDSDNSQLASVVLNDGTTCEIWKMTGSMLSKVVFRLTHGGVCFSSFKN